MNPHHCGKCIQNTHNIRMAFDFIIFDATLWKFKITACTVRVDSNQANKEEHAASERTSRAGKWSREEHQCGAYAVSSS